MSVTKEITVDTWEEFIEKLQELEKARKIPQGSFREITPFLYRGQANSNWTLTTTLERYIEKPFSLRDYYNLILRTEPIIYPCTGRAWDIPDLSTFENWKVDQLNVRDFPAYEYMVHLRHHGFPSPLLDWTRSASIAAHFAFAQIPIDNEANV